MRGSSRQLHGGIRILAACALLVPLSCDFGIPTTLQPPPHHACFRVVDPYAGTGTWHRANFHMHSWHSDGALTPEELVDLYSRNGYTLLCITDHNQYGDQDGGVVPRYQKDEAVHDWNGDGAVHPHHVFGSGLEAYVRDYAAPRPKWSTDLWQRPQSLPWDEMPVVLPGAEMSHGGWHFGIVGLPGGPLEPPDAGQGFFERAHQAGGFTFLAHPGEWNSLPDQLAAKLDLHKFDGLEIMNGLRLTRLNKASSSDSGDRCSGNEPPDATPLWDALLARGYRLWALANDDSHKWGNPDDDAYPFTAFDMVHTTDPSPEGFLAAVRSGSFYASTGLFFAEIGVEGDRVVASAPDAERLRFVGWGGRVLLEVEGQQASWDVKGDEGYVRVEAIGKEASGHPWLLQAWSQPFFLEDAACDNGAPARPQTSKERDTRSGS